MLLDRLIRLSVLVPQGRKAIAQDASPGEKATPNLFVVLSAAPLGAADSCLGFFRPASGADKQPDQLQSSFPWRLLFTGHGPLTTSHCRCCWPLVTNH